MPYCFQYALSNKATCMKCRENIKKNLLRVGTLVNFKGNRSLESYKWRHWTCITPAVRKNITKYYFDQDQLTGKENLRRLPGFNALDKKHQQIIREALLQGHIDNRYSEEELTTTHPDRIVGATNKENPRLGAKDGGRKGSRKPSYEPSEGTETKAPPCSPSKPLADLDKNRIRWR